MNLKNFFNSLNESEKKEIYLLAAGWRGDVNLLEAQKFIDQLSLEDISEIRKVYRDNSNTVWKNPTVRTIVYIREKYEKDKIGLAIAKNVVEMLGGKQ